jgi:hypothetical protein
MRFTTIIIILMLQGFTGNTDTLQTIDGTITAADTEYTYIDTADGNGWVIDYNSRLQPNDEITIVFDTLGTESIYDDEIVAVVLNDEVIQ